MDIILSKFLLVIPKKLEFKNDILNDEIKEVFNFNEQFFRYCIITNKNNLKENRINQSTLFEYGIKVEEDLCLKVATMKINKKLGYTSFHPYSMRQAHFLYTQKIPIEYIESLYSFNKNEIIQGYAVKKGIKSEFYADSLESDTIGYYYFSHNILGKPEFISEEALNFLR